MQLSSLVQKGLAWLGFRRVAVLCRAVTAGASVGGRGGVHWHGRRRPRALALAWEAVADAGGGGGGGRWRGRRRHATGSRERSG